MELELRDKKVAPRDPSPESAQPVIPEEHEWPAQGMSLPREALMVMVVCMAQFCTRKLKSSLSLSEYN